MCKYTLTWGWDVIVITTIFIIAIIVASYISIERAGRIASFVTITLYVIITVGTFLFLPWNIGCDKKCLYITQLKGRTEIPYNEIIEIKPIDKEMLKGSVRSFGSGGLFGYLGRFKSNSLGSYTMFVTRRTDYIYIKTTNNTYIFSCTYRNELIQTCMSNMHSKKK